MTQHIDDFADEARVALTAFADEARVALTAFVDDYKRANADKPKMFPLELGDENSGLWWEFFMDFAAGKED